MIDIITYWVAVTLVCFPITAIGVFLVVTLLYLEVRRITKGEVNLLENTLNKLFGLIDRPQGAVIVFSILFVAMMQIVAMFGFRGLRELSTIEFIHHCAVWLQPQVWWVMLIVGYIFCSKYLMQLYSFLSDVKKKLDKIKKEN